MVISQRTPASLIALLKHIPQMLIVSQEILKQNGLVMNIFVSKCADITVSCIEKFMLKAVFVEEHRLAILSEAFA